MSGSKSRRLLIANTLGVACVAAGSFLAACSDSEGVGDDTSNSGAGSGGKSGVSAGQAGADVSSGGASAGSAQAGDGNAAGEGGESGEGGEGPEAGAAAGSGAGGTAGASGGSAASGSVGSAGTSGSGGSAGAPVVLTPNCVRDTTSGKKVKLSSGNDGLFAAAYSDGFVYAAGYTQPTTSAQEDRSTVVVRLTTAGAIDTSWANNGIATINVKVMDTGATAVAGLGELARGLAFQGNKIIVAGTVEAYTSVQNPSVLNNDRDVFVLRLNADGTLDTTFGDKQSGIHILPLNTGVQGTNASGNPALLGADAQWGLNVLPNGKIIVTAATRNAGLDTDDSPRTDTDFAVVRLTADGAQDASFGLNSTGVYTLDIAQAGASVRTASVLADGKLIVTGYSSYGGTQRPVIFKLLENGSGLDTTFGANGVFSEPVGAAAEAYGALLQPSTMKLVTVGYGRATSGQASSDILSIRLTPSGVLDTTYGATATPGRTWFDVGGLGDNGRAILLSDERPVLLGGGSLSPGQQDAVIAVLSANGTPLTSFGSAYGCIAYDFGSIGDFFWAGAVLGDGKIAAVGLTGHASASTEDTDGIFVLIDKP